MNFEEKVQVTELEEKVSDEQKEKEMKARQKRVYEFIRNNLLDVEFDELEDQKETCGICINPLVPENIDEMEYGQQLKGVPQCSHYFHQECLLKWVKKKIKHVDIPDCPLCKAPF